jgi:hypothetical protein
MTKKQTTKAEDDIPFDLATTPKGGEVAAYDYSAFADQGFESHTRDDYAVPFLGVLQSNSPLVESNASARPGMLVNTVTQQLYDGKEGILFIPVHTQHNVLEWKPRNLGGGFVAAHTMDSDLVQKAKEEQEFGKWKTVKGDEKSNDLIETQSVYGVFVNEHGSAEQMIISFSSTKIRKYKAWMTKARTVQIPLPNGRKINAPLFAHKYRITSVGEKNAKGSFYNFDINFDGGSSKACLLPTNDPLFQAAVAFHELLKDGSINVAYDTQKNAGESTEEGETPFK